MKIDIVDEIVNSANWSPKMGYEISTIIIGYTDGGGLRFKYILYTRLDR